MKRQLISQLIAIFGEISAKKRKLKIIAAS
jgi:hypothetical protein